jgi:late competence protein required for DNA uptake (superfamily II DNA/RNA helicase)
MNFIEDLDSPDIEMDSAAIAAKFLRDLDCKVCFSLPKQPMQHTACGVLFCKECLEAKLAGPVQLCPNIFCEERQNPFYMLDNRGKFSIL